MNKQIRTYDDMCEEKKRLEELIVFQKAQVRENWQGIKEELKPVSNAISFVGRMTHRDKTNPLINMGIDMAGDLLLRRGLLSKAGLVTRLTVPYIFKKVSSNLLSGTENTASLFKKIVNVFRKKEPAQAGMDAVSNQ